MKLTVSLGTLQVIRNGVVRSAKVAQDVVFKPLPADSVTGNVSFQHERTNRLDRFIFVGDDFFVDTGCKVGRSRPVTALFGDLIETWDMKPRPETDVIDWGEAIKARARMLFVDEETIWRRCPQPVLRVRSNPRGWDMSLVPGEANFSDDNMMCFHFGMNELSEAQDWMAGLAGSRETFSGELMIDGEIARYLPGRRIDAWRVANAVRQDFRVLKEDPIHIPVSCLPLYFKMEEELGIDTGSRYRRPRQRTTDFAAMEDKEALSLIETSAFLTGIVRHAGKLNFPRYARPFERHLFRWDRWMKQNDITRRSTLLRLVMNQAPDPDMDMLVQSLDVDYPVSIETL
jgi:hypothetical protein